MPGFYTPGVGYTSQAGPWCPEPTSLHRSSSALPVQEDPDSDGEVSGPTPGRPWGEPTTPHLSHTHTCCRNWSCTSQSPSSSWMSSQSWRSRTSHWSRTHRRWRRPWRSWASPWKTPRSVCKSQVGPPGPVRGELCHWLSSWNPHSHWELDCMCHPHTLPVHSPGPSLTSIFWKALFEGCAWFWWDVPYWAGRLRVIGNQECSGSRSCGWGHTRLVHYHPGAVWSQKGDILRTFHPRYILLVPGPGEVGWAESGRGTRWGLLGARNSLPNTHWAPMLGQAWV